MRDALAAFALGAVACAPLVAWSGGDLCPGPNPYSYDELVLAPTSTLVDGVAVAPSRWSSARPLPWDPHAVTLESDDRNTGLDTDDRHAEADVIDPRDASRLVQLWLVRQ